MKCEGKCCSGCSRHCCLDAPKCKYGVKCAAKLQCEPCKTQKKYKWEKYASRSGVLGQLILSGRGAKKALLKRSLTEQQLLKNLTEQEQLQLSVLLAKLMPLGKCV